MALQDITGEYRVPPNYGEHTDTPLPAIVDPYTEITSFPDKKGIYTNPDLNKLRPFIKNILDRVYSLHLDSPAVDVDEYGLAYSTIRSLDTKSLDLDSLLVEEVEAAEYWLQEIGYNVPKENELVDILTEKIKESRSTDNVNDLPFDGRYNSDQLRYVVDLELLGKYAEDKKVRKLADESRRKIRNNTLTRSEQSRRSALTKGIGTLAAITGLGIVENLPIIRSMGVEKITRTESSDRINPETLRLLSSLSESFEDFAGKLKLSAVPFVSVLDTPYRMFMELKAGKDPSKSKSDRISGLYKLLSNPQMKPGIDLQNPENMTSLKNAINEIASEISISMDDTQTGIIEVRKFMAGVFGPIFPIDMLTLPSELKLNESHGSFAGKAIDIAFNSKNDHPLIDFFDTLIHEAGHGLEFLGNYESPYISEHPELFDTQTYIARGKAYMESLTALTFGDESKEIKGLVNYDLKDLFGFYFGANSWIYGRDVTDSTPEQKEKRYTEALKIFDLVIKPNLPLDFEFPSGLFPKGFDTFSIEMFKNLIGQDERKVWELVEKIYVIGAVCSIKSRDELIATAKAAKLSPEKKQELVYETQLYSLHATEYYLNRACHQLMSIPDIGNGPLTSKRALPDFVNAARYFHDQVLAGSSIHSEVKNYKELLAFIEKTSPGAVIKRSF